MITALLNRLLIVLLFVIMYGSAKAQPCPSGWYYGGPRTVLLDGTAGCNYIVEFCYRTVGSRTQFMITSIKEGPGNNCTRDWGYIFDNISPWFLDQGQGSCSSGLNPCSWNQPEISNEMMMGTCWEIVNLNPDPNGQPVEQCQICPEETGYCLFTYERCCDGSDQVVVTKTGSQLILSGNCNQTFNPLFYTYGQCYTMLTCE